MSKPITLLANTAALVLSACNSGSGSCPDCDIVEETDLPSGGVDLMTDDLNCGVYGNECYVDYPDGPFEAGGCNEGKCGPRWFEAYLGPIPEPPEMTCAEVCATYDLPCVPQGVLGVYGLHLRYVVGGRLLAHRSVRIPLVL